MYIVFEGIVGSGKTTQVKLLGEYFRSLGKSVTFVREPGSTPISEDIRYLAQAKLWVAEEMHPLTNAYLYTAARAQTLQTIVKPALAREDVVISDRSFLSSCAIQGEAQGLGIDTVLEINKEAIKGCMPDIIFYLDIECDRALGRTFDEGGDKFEKAGIEFYKKIISGYEKIFLYPEFQKRCIRIDASGNTDEVFQKIKEYIQ